MAVNLFKQANYPLSKLIEDIDTGEIGLPDIPLLAHNHRACGVPGDVPTRPRAEVRHYQLAQALEQAHRTQMLHRIWQQ